MLWRIQRVSQASRSWKRVLGGSRQPVTSPFTPLLCIRAFRCTSLRPNDIGHSKDLYLPIDPGQRRRVLDAPADHGFFKSPVPYFLHSQLIRDKHLLEKDRVFEKEIRLAGLVQSIRRQKKAAFAHVSDGSTLEPFQAVLSPEQAAGITNGSYVELVGMWQKSLGRGQSHELQVQRVEEIGPSDPEQYPIQKKYHSQEYLRTLPHLRLRAPVHSLVARARGKLIDTFTSHFSHSGLIQVHPPIITSSDCEGAGEVFAVNPQADLSRSATDKEPQQYFREPKYLTVSSQLHLEAYCAELGDVFAISPTFRAEASDTPRHLSEFYMLEAEYRGVQTLESLMAKVERHIQTAVASFRSSQPAQELLQYYSDRKHRGAEEQIDLESRWRRLTFPDDEVGRYHRVSHQDAVKSLLKADEAVNESLFKTKPSYTNGLQLEHERWIVDNIGDGRPVFVMHYPKAAKPFYMLPSERQKSEEGVETVACFDLLLPFGYCEVVGGSLREHRLEDLISNMRKRGMLRKRDPAKPAKDSEYPFLQPDEDLGSLRWYADLRRFGPSPHGGYGLGFDRLLAYLTGVSNVRDVVAFPRTWGRADC